MLIAAIRPDSVNFPLLLHVLADFRRRGLPRAALSVHGGNDRASRLYESVGMRPAWRHDRYDRRHPQR